MDDYRRLPFTTKSELVEDQAANPPVRNQPHVPRVGVYADSLHLGNDGTDASRSSIPRRAGPGSRDAGRKSIGSSASDRGIGCSPPSASVRSWASGRGSKPPIRSERKPSRAEPRARCSDSTRSSIAARRSSSRRRPTLCRLAEVARENGIDIAGSAVARHDPRGRAGREHPGDAEPDRVGVGRARVGSRRSRRGGRVGLRVPRGRRDACARVRVRRRGARGRRRRRGGRGRDRRARPHEPWTMGGTRRALPHRRSGSAFARLPAIAEARSFDSQEAFSVEPTKWSRCEGVNVYPAAVESIVREESRDLRVSNRDRRTATHVGDAGGNRVWSRREARGGESAARESAAVRASVSAPRSRLVPAGSLPRFELKARRFRIRSGGIAK